MIQYHYKSNYIYSKAGVKQMTINKFNDNQLDHKPINSINSYLKNEFGEKTIKLSIDGGFTCPNRDGSKGIGGCIFCSSSGSGDFASTIDEQIKLLSNKWPHAKYLAYFQNHTNTYAPATELRIKFENALNNPLISGIAIATRPDCLSSEILDLLEEINQKHFMWVELGLQTIHKKTADLTNRCYGLSDFDHAMAELSNRKIKTVVHLILGLPGESRNEMFDSLEYICGNAQNTLTDSPSVPAWGIKLHLLNVVKGSQMETSYPDYVSFNSIEDYVNLVTDMLEVIPPEITIHRLTADAPRKILISPEWSYKKLTILNGINAELKKRGSFQGCKLLK